MPSPLASPSDAAAAAADMPIRQPREYIRISYGLFSQHTFVEMLALPRDAMRYTRCVIT